MKKIIDHNGRLFGLISIVDVLVLAVVAVSVIALNYKHNVVDPKGTTTPNTTITFTAQAEYLPDYVAQAIAVGDLVFDKDQSTGGAIGKITSVELLPATATREMVDGSLVLAAAEGRYNVLITVEGSGLVTDGRYSINRIYEIGVNASRNLYTKYALFKAEFLEVH